MKLGGYVHHKKSRPSSNVKVKGQGHQGQKTGKLLSHPVDNAQYGVRRIVGRTQQAATDDTIAWPPGSDVLRRWKNQRTLSSFLLNMTSCSHLTLLLSLSDSTAAA